MIEHFCCGMSDPIKERILIIRFKTLESSVFEGIFSLIKAYVKTKLADYEFVEEWRKIPEIKKPRMTDNGDEPDWSQMKLSVFRIARLKDKKNGILIQLSEDFLTINAISCEALNGIGDFDRLLQFYERFVPCLDDRVGSRFRDVKLKTEVVYGFDQEALQDFIIEKDCPGKRDYFDIQSIIHPGIESKPEGFDMNPPLHLSSHYSLSHQSKKFELDVVLDVDFRGGSSDAGWRMSLDLEALSREDPCLGNRWGVDLLRGMSDVQYECVRRLMTTDAFEKLKVRQ